MRKSLNPVLKYFFIFILSFSSPVQAFAQSLEGVWQGQFTYDASLRFPTTYLALNIDKGPDGSYEIHSYTRLPMRGGKDSVIVCKVQYQKSGKNTIKLQEYKFLNANFDESTLQTMFLRMKEKRDKTILTGYWESMDQGGFTSKPTGRITLTRK